MHSQADPGTEEGRFTVRITSFFFRVDGRLKKKYIRKADARDLWESYSLQREIQRKRIADRKEFAGLCRDLRRIDKVMVQMILSEGSGAFE